MNQQFRHTSWGRYLVNSAHRVLAACTRILGLPTGVAFEIYYYLVQHRLRNSLRPTSDVAVCVHLYNIDQWEMFAKKLAGVDTLQFDLFVTLPHPVSGFADTILADVTDAHVVIVPNRGRGTLPFIKVAQVLLERGYEIVLKIHCRNTANRGPLKLQAALNTLLPESPRLLLDIVHRLRSPDIAVIGPSELYCCIDAFTYGTRERLAAMIARRFGRVAAHAVLSRQAEYGQFCGTTFWARLDALSPLLRFRAYDFEPELHQRKHTLPHLLETLFSLVPRVENRQVLAINDGEISPAGDSYAAVSW